MSLLWFGHEADWIMFFEADWIIFLADSEGGQSDPDGTKRTLLVEEEDHTGLILSILAIFIVVIVVALFIYNKQKKKKT